MRLSIIFICGLLALACAAASATSPAANSDLLGVWRANEGDLPAITLQVTDETGPLSGAVLFYIIRRDPGHAPTASAGIPGPLFYPQITGDTLTFTVSHRLAHPPRTLSDPPVAFRLKLEFPNRAQLTRLEDGVSVEMTKDQ